MLLVRPITHEDIDGLYNLAQQTGPGLTSLPANKELLAAKIEASINSFKSKAKKPGRELYVLVLENTETNEILGSSAIKAKVGGFEPFYSYEIEEAHHKSEKLKVDKKIPYLQLKAEHNGPSIIQSLFVAPGNRGSGYGKLLSRARFLFIAAHKNRFEDTIIAEMRGVIDKNGYSPFWEHVVRPFFDMEYQKADFLSSTDKGFIADLMPKHPIYIPLLAKDVIDVIGEVHTHTEAAINFLFKEGFKKDQHVDIFDAGPRVSCPVNEINSIKNSKSLQVSAIVDEATIETSKTSKENLISNQEIDFKLSRARVIETKEGLQISKNLAKLLNLKINDYALLA